MSKSTTLGMMLPNYKIYYAADSVVPYISYNVGSNEVQTVEITESNILNIISADVGKHFISNPIELKCLTEYLTESAFNYNCEEVATRIANFDGQLIYKLSEDLHQIVMPGKTFTTNAPPEKLTDKIHFLKSSRFAAQAIPQPPPNGLDVVQELSKMLHLEGGDRITFWVALVAAFHPSIKKPTLYFKNRQANARLQMKFVLAELLDPINKESLLIDTVSTPSYLRFSDSFEELPCEGDFRTTFPCYVCDSLKNYELSHFIPDDFVCINQEPFSNNIDTFSDFKKKFSMLKPFVMYKIFETLAKALRLFNSYPLGRKNISEAYHQWCGAISMALFGSFQRFNQAFMKRKGLPLNEIDTLTFAIAKTIEKADHLPLKFTLFEARDFLDSVIGQEVRYMADLPWSESHKEFKTHLRAIRSDLNRLGYEVNISRDTLTIDQIKPSTNAA